jgi:hypothetical protein
MPLDERGVRPLPLFALRRLLPCLPATGAGLAPLAAQLGLEVDRG